MGEPANDRGSVTAEFALVLPAVTLVLAIAIGGLGLQVERIGLVGSAAMAARAVARGEPIDLSQPFSANGAGQTLLRGPDESADNMLCVTAYKEVSIFGLPEKLFELNETQCARKAGL